MLSAQPQVTAMLVLLLLCSIRYLEESKFDVVFTDLVGRYWWNIFQFLLWFSEFFLWVMPCSLDFETTTQSPFLRPQSIYRPCRLHGLSAVCKETNPGHPKLVCL